ncbi:hypothetical protein [Verrucomicrobium spinosum]|nr:hypothetical protein [Verrucomicrobium spinosum]
MFLRQVFDSHLAQYAYVIGCQKSGEASSSTLCAMFPSTRRSPLPRA